MFATLRRRGYVHILPRPPPKFKAPLSLETHYFQWVLGSVGY
jgi:hypothetical protein